MLFSYSKDSNQFALQDKQQVIAFIWTELCFQVMNPFWAADGTNAFWHKMSLDIRRRKDLNSLVCKSFQNTCIFQIASLKLDEGVEARSQLNTKRTTSDGNLEIQCWIDE